MLKKLRNKVINFIFNTYANQNIFEEKNIFETDEFNKNVTLCFNELTKNVTKSTNPYIIRLGGQCGSGKTTQLVPSINGALKKCNKTNYIHLAVRFFAKYHPNYEKLLAEFGDGLIREKTNAVALAYLLVIAEKLITNGYNILFEVSLLDPVFEEYFIKLSKINNYNIIYNIMAIPFEISNQWIEKRINAAGDDRGRIMPINTLYYFDYILTFGLKQILALKEMFNKNDYVILWGITSDQPLLVTNEFNDNIINIFKYNRKFNNSMLNRISDEIISLENKSNFYNQFFKEFIYD